MIQGTKYYALLDRENAKLLQTRLKNNDYMMSFSQLSISLTAMTYENLKEYNKKDGNRTLRLSSIKNLRLTQFKETEVLIMFSDVEGEKFKKRMEIIDNVYDMKKTLIYLLTNKTNRTSKLEFNPIISLWAGLNRIKINKRNIVETITSGCLEGRLPLTGQILDINFINDLPNLDLDFPIDKTYFSANHLKYSTIRNFQYIVIFKIVTDKEKRIQMIKELFELGMLHYGSKDIVEYKASVINKYLYDNMYAYTKKELSEKLYNYFGNNVLNKDNPIHELYHLTREEVERLFHIGAYIGDYNVFNILLTTYPEYKDCLPTEKLIDSGFSVYGLLEYEASKRKIFNTSDYSDLYMLVVAYRSIAIPTFIPDVLNRYNSDFIKKYERFVVGGFILSTLTTYLSYKDIPNGMDLIKDEVVDNIDKYLVDVLEKYTTIEHLEYSISTYFMTSRTRYVNGIEYYMYSKIFDSIDQFNDYKYRVRLSNLKKKYQSKL